MGTIRIEFLPVQTYGLGLFGFDHLQLTYQDETDLLDTQDHWYVLEGVVDGSPIFGGTLGVLGTDGTTLLSSANLASRDELIAKIGTPETRGSRPVLNTIDAQSKWNSMAGYGAEIENQNFPYIAGAWPFSPKPTINSNSAVASMLWSIGINVANVMPFDFRRAPGIATLLGTTDNDDLGTEGVFTQLLGGLGKDTLHGAVNLIWVEKIYGGNDDDWIMWSKGENIIHGGQIGTIYADDGLDTIDYSGVGEVQIIATKHGIEHKSPTFISAFEGGSDQMYSIEQVAWDPKNDKVSTGQGVELLEKPLLLDMKGNSTGRGDTFGMGEGDTPLIIVVDNDMTAVQTVANQGLDAGYWVRSAEWLQGSKSGDKIYGGNETRGIEGGAGNDLIDGRQSAAFSAASPLGYDIELYGDDGNDTIVSGSGRTYASGGSGSDMFVLSAMTSGAGTVELVINDADVSDKLYVPYDYFKVDRGDYDGSTLFQLTGAPFKIDGVTTTSYFAWGKPADDQVHGNIEFVGLISYTLDGSDLIISLLQGHPEEYTVDYGEGEPPGPTYLLSVGEESTRSLVRVKNWSEGVLGLKFPVVYDANTYATSNSLEDYPGWMNAVNEATAPSRFIDPLELRPDAHQPLEFAQTTTVAARTATTFMSVAAANTTGTADNDVLSATSGGPYHFYGYAGNDDITGTRGGDVIDGGAGNDIMRGGLGNDTYYVDSALDEVIETERGGFDRVIASIDYQLGAFVEHAALAGNARAATGNALRNTLEGNDLDNTLSGAEGDDTLAGNGGDDILIGGSGGDGYVCEMGDGRDTIIDTPELTGDGNVIILTGGMVAADVRFQRASDTSPDLILSFSEGGSITVRDYFSTAQPIISGIEFLTGTVWSSGDISGRAAAAVITSNTAPSARDDNFLSTLSGTFTLSAAAFLANDRDADSDTLTIASVSGATGGTVTLNSGGTLTFNSGSSNTIGFDYLLSDGNGGFDTGHADLLLSPRNAAPTITASTLAAVREDTPAAGSITATDADGDTLVFAVKSGDGPTKGSVAFTGNGGFTYAPSPNANGSEHFIITVTDGRTAPIEQSFDFQIAAVNDKPIAKADSGFNVTSGTQIVIKPSALLRNDSDVDGDALTVKAVSAAVGGTVSRAANGDIIFKATAASGSGGFTYTVSDGHGGTSAATVDIAIKPAPRPTEIVGTSHQDTLIGTNWADIFVGKGGNDTMIGRGGNDIFKVAGNAGLDRIDAGAGFDMILGSRGADIIRVDSRLSNFSNLEKIDGGAGFDRIISTYGNDYLDFSKLDLQGIEVIDLGAGNDVVRGSAGNDVFRGGSGHDTFVIRPGGGNDTILDFVGGYYWMRNARDMLDLRGTGIKDMSDLFSRLHQEGHDTVLTVDSSTHVRFKDVHIHALTADKYWIL